MNKINDCIFIVGCGHSGTTILNKIIGNHKNIYGLNYETGIFIHNKNKQIILQKLQTLDQQRQLSQKKWLCEKTPGHVYHIDDILSFIENPKIIVVIRDGRDVVASLYQRYCDLEQSIYRWINDNLAWIAHDGSQNFCLIKYENFVISPQKELMRVCEYLQEPYDNHILEYTKDVINLPNLTPPINKTAHSLLRLYQINQNIYDGSKRYLKDLNADQLNTILANNQFMQIMQQLGYL